MLASKPIVGRDDASALSSVEEAIKVPVDLLARYRHNGV